jgi:hypothetical protein
MCKEHILLDTLQLLQNCTTIGIVCFDRPHSRSPVILAQLAGRQERGGGVLTGSLNEGKRGSEMRITSYPQPSSALRHSLPPEMSDSTFDGETQQAPCRSLPRRPGPAMQDRISHRHRHLMFNFSLSSVPRRSLSRGERWLARDAIEMKDSGLIFIIFRSISCMAVGCRAVPSSIYGAEKKTKNMALKA